MTFSESPVHAVIENVHNFVENIAKTVARS
jgi:hypothetical protein